MSRKKLDPLRVACWRFQLISALLDPRLAPAERKRLARDMAKTPQLWPSGREAPIPVSTLYRWWKRHRQDPRIESLFPKPRTRSDEAPTIDPKWLQYALALLEEEPRRSLFILSLKIRDRFSLPNPPFRSSLHRALQKEPRYIDLRRRARGERKLRCRFQAQNPHEIWHADAKGEFTVRFADGSERKIKVLSILDDASRFILRALIVITESTEAAVSTFRQAAARYGLPEKFYADRGSAYDSEAFRKGLAILGIHRIETKAKNPEAHGKIEAYHRTLKLWFVVELKHQLVLDLKHLQDLLDATLDQIYHQHPHKELRNKTPGEVFQNRFSKRLVSLERLREAFLVEKVIVPDRKTGTIRVAGTLFKVPRELWGPSRKVRIAIDPEESSTPFLVVKPGIFQKLEPAIRKAGPSPTEVKAREEPIGALTPLLERYRGRTLPQARAGFGLPEIYKTFSEILGRRVPQTELEAATVVDWLHRNGPLDPKAFQVALAQTMERLGEGRPLAQILENLQQKIRKEKL